MRAPLGAPYCRGCLPFPSRGSALPARHKLQVSHDCGPARARPSRRPRPSSIRGRGGGGGCGDGDGRRACRDMRRREPHDRPYSNGKPRRCQPSRGRGPPPTHPVP
eukprot:scaffold2058_cov403-Prasinococcus_capsulatus_cf.AAC.6